MVTAFRGVQLLTMREPGEPGASPFLETSITGAAYGEELDPILTKVLLENSAKRFDCRRDAAACAPLVGLGLLEP